MSRGDGEALRGLLERIDGRGYRAYRDLKGAWDLGGTCLWIDHVQGDPFAAPSRVRVEIPSSVASFPAWACQPGPRAAGLASHLARAFATSASERSGGSGSGRSGEIRMEKPGQQVLVQSAVQVDRHGAVEARFGVGLPGHGRRIAGRSAAALLTETIPLLVRDSLIASAHDEAVLAGVVECNEDAEALREALVSSGLLAFVADGSILPRRSCVDDRPLEAGAAVPFRTPDSLRVRLATPNAGTVTGMGIPRGVTVIVGGGFHGKSTLLRALQVGIYNHRPGDGRERTVTDRNAVKIRAEDGRAVSGVDISLFINDLPGGLATLDFSTPNASGSTSQAAAISEALEVGARALLVDEDTAATNFMIRDRRMQVLIPGSDEPITPFVDRVRWLWQSRGVSSVLVVGGSGDYLEVADTVIAMRHYVAEDVTRQAAAVVENHPTGRLGLTGGAEPGPLPRRIPVATSIDPRRGKRAVSVKAHARDRIEFGTQDVDLSALEQLVCRAQSRAIGDALVMAQRRFMNGTESTAEILDQVMGVIENEGLDALDPRRVGDLAVFRRFELVAALNRLRSLQIVVVPA